MTHRMGDISRRHFLGLSILPAAACLMACGQGADDSSNASNKVRVAASFYPMYDFAHKVGGDRVEVTCLVPAGTEPHDWEPSTADLRTIADAQVLVYNGAGMEHWVSDTLASLDASTLTTVEASEGADLLTLSDDALEEEREEHGEAGGDPREVSDTDPHCWLSPLIAKQELARIADGLSQADPDGADAYRANAERWEAECDTLMQEFTDGLSGLANRTIVVSHEAFGYLCRDAGLTQLPIEGIEADAEPDAQQMSKIVDFVREHDVRTIFSEELVSPKVAQSIADATGATVEELNPLEGLSDEELAAGEDYFSVMRENLRKIEEALA